jgi:hypothetical protein
MSHHSDLPFSEDDLRKFRDHQIDQFSKSMPADQTERINKELDKYSGSQMFGKTQDHPDGKLNENDEGGINFGITNYEDRVILNFNTPVHWIGFTKQQALEVANSLLRKADKIKGDLEPQRG